MKILKVFFKLMSVFGALWIVVFIHLAILNPNFDLSSSPELTLRTIFTLMILYFFIFGFIGIALEFIIREAISKAISQQMPSMDMMEEIIRKAVVQAIIQTRIK